LKFIRDWITRAEQLAPPLTLSDFASQHPAPTWPNDPRQPRPDPRQPQPDPREKRPPATPAPDAAASTLDDPARRGLVRSADGVWTKDPLEVSPPGGRPLSRAEFELHAIRIRD
jgi:hypothetical protein